LHPKLLGTLEMSRGVAQGDKRTGLAAEAEVIR